MDFMFQLNEEDGRMCWKFSHTTTFGVGKRARMNPSDPRSAIVFPSLPEVSAFAEMTNHLLIDREADVGGYQILVYERLQTKLLITPEFDL